MLTAANSDDIEVSDVPGASPIRYGGIGSAVAGHGLGYSFPSCTLIASDVINNAYLSLMQSGTTGSQQVISRLFAIDEDNRGSFTTSSPNRPGDPAIVGTVAATTDSQAYTSGVRYEWPRAAQTTERANLGAALAAVFDRAGWASGNSICVVCNSDQDASASTGFSRTSTHDHNSATANSEPTLVIDYTVASAGQPTMVRWGGVHNMHRTSRQRRGW